MRPPQQITALLTLIDGERTRMEIVMWANLIIAVQIGGWWCVLPLLLAIGAYVQGSKRGHMYAIIALQVHQQSQQDKDSPEHNHDT
jgi:hypothetical protein